MVVPQSHGHMQPICGTESTPCVPKDKAIMKFITQNRTDHSCQRHFQAMLFDTYMLPKLYVKQRDYVKVHDYV